MRGSFIPVLVLSSLLLMSLGAVPENPESKTWALIIAPTHEGGHVLEDALEMRTYLLDHGLDDDSIIFLTDGSTESFVDGDATKAEIEDAFDYLAANVAVNDDVIIVLGDDGVFGGGHSKFITSDDQEVSDDVFAYWVDSIDCSDMVVVCSFDYSGGFIDDLTAPNRLVLTSHAATESSANNAYNIVDGLTEPSADANNDGKVSFEEAHLWVAADISGQTPQMDDNLVGEFIL